MSEISETMMNALIDDWEFPIRSEKDNYHTIIQNIEPPIPDDGGGSGSGGCCDIEPISEEEINDVTNNGIEALSDDDIIS